jgi:hypothetical protein
MRKMLQTTSKDITQKLGSARPVRVTHSQLKEEVRNEFERKEEMMRKMNNQEKTLFSLF